MNKDLELLTRVIDEKSAKILDANDKIWEYAELAFHETRSAALLKSILKEEGFTLTEGDAGIPTCFTGTFSYGTGKPVMGILGEYDALSSLSQKAADPHKEPLTEGAPGHGCGHCALGTGALAAAIAVKEYLIANKKDGTIIYFGCPAEEGAGAKQFMARAGMFDNVDFVYSWHPATKNAVECNHSNAIMGANFYFKGVASHAGATPYLGRSALDAVELTDIGANYLREHVPSDVRIHYTIVDGGVAPNIVPDKAVVWYYMRAFSREVVENVYERLVKVAKGAAMMTETELEIEFLGGCYNTQNNHVLAGVVAEAMNEIPQEPWTQEELDFAAALDEQTADAARATTKKYGLSADTHLYTGPGQVTCFNSYGSTDVGDVMHLVPTAYFFTACTNMGAPAHSWQFASCAGSSIGEKGMIYAAKVMALYGLKLIEKPELIAQAKEEFDRQMEGRSYKCPIPDGMTMPW